MRLEQGGGGIATTTSHIKSSTQHLSLLDMSFVTNFRSRELKGAMEWGGTIWHSLFLLPRMPGMLLRCSKNDLMTSGNSSFDTLLCCSGEVWRTWHTPTCTALWRLFISSSPINQPHRYIYTRRCLLVLLVVVVGMGDGKGIVKGGLSVVSIYPSCLDFWYSNVIFFLLSFFLSWIVQHVNLKKEGGKRRHWNFELGAQANLGYKGKGKERKETSLHNFPSFLSTFLHYNYLYFIYLLSISNIHALHLHSHSFVYIHFSRFKIQTFDSKKNMQKSFRDLLHFFSFLSFFLGLASL